MGEECFTLNYRTNWPDSSLRNHGVRCVLTILELNWNQRFRDKKAKLNICHHMPTSSTQLQDRSFHVVGRTRTSAKCQKMKTARVKRAKYCFSLSNMQILRYSCCRRLGRRLSSLFTEFNAWLLTFWWLHWQSWLRSNCENKGKTANYKETRRSYPAVFRGFYKIYPSFMHQTFCWIF